MTVALPAPETAIAAARSAVWLAEAAHAGEPMPPLRRRREPGRPLSVTYLMPRTDVGGGARVLLEHANHLSALGLSVTVVAQGPPPDWFGLRVPFVSVGYGEPPADAIPPCDLIVAGYWDLVLPARRRAIAPVVHFEQGDFHLYEQLPPSVRSLVGPFLWAADDTIAVGPAAQEALAERYEVRAGRVANAVDVERFYPAPRRPGATPTVLFVGWDGTEFKGIADARAIAAGLARSHPAARVVWVTPRPPCHGPLGETVVDPDADRLARLYREADVYVCVSRYESFPLPPLEAMASGAAVVSTANGGIAAFGRHNENCLIVPVGDVAGLLEATRRLLDDEPLANRLRSAGLATARALSWPAIAREVAGRYEALAGRAEVEPPLGEFDLELEGLRFCRPGDEARLRDRLRACATSELAVPVSQPAALGHRVVRWRVIARRDEGVPGVTRAYLPLRSDEPLGDAPYQPALAALRAGRPQRALGDLLERCRGAPRAEEAVLGRWIVLALVGCGQVAEALETAGAFARDHPGHPDYLYLALACARAGGIPGGSGLAAAVAAIRAGAAFDEWFDDPAGLLRVALAA
ncbi:MAG TPA: glycosyltransferase family 4 protein [Acidimicrobiales bacterium]|nr:glycosyltransferase family 4 protein [Acidimicrobiales bacterium]